MLLRVVLAFFVAVVVGLPVGCGSDERTAQNPRERASESSRAETKATAGAATSPASSFASSSSPAAASSAGSATLSGRVRIGGIIPTAAYEVVIYEKDGKTIATRAKTDEQGAYSISLAPGSYCLFVPTKDERDRVVGIRRDISVGPSEHQTLNLSVDRGGK